MYGLQPNHQNMWGIVNDNTVLQHFTAVEIQEVIVSGDQYIMKIKNQVDISKYSNRIKTYRINIGK